MPRSKLQQADRDHSYGGCRCGLGLLLWFHLDENNKRLVALNWYHVYRLLGLALLVIGMVGLVVGLIVLALYKTLEIDKIERRLDALEEFRDQIEKEKGDWRYE